MNCDNVLTANAASGRDTITGQRILPIASLYGTPFIRVICMGVEGPCSFENCTPESIGVVTGFASVSLNLSPMVPFTWSPPNMYTQNRNANFGPFPYPSDRNDPFDSKNKTVRRIFDWVKIEGVITLRPVRISPLGA